MRFGEKAKEMDNFMESINAVVREARRLWGGGVEGLGGCQSPGGVARCPSKGSQVVRKIAESRCEPWHVAGGGDPRG